MFNFNHTVISRLRKTLFLVLVVAFLAAQWTTAHIHLAGQHDHDGNSHQHELASHGHQLLNPHESIDLSHDFLDGSTEVVELSCDCNTKNASKLGDQATASVAAIIPLDINFKSEILLSSNFNVSYHRYIDSSTIQLRAPPQIS